MTARKRQDAPSIMQTRRTILLNPPAAELALAAQQALLLACDRFDVFLFLREFTLESALVDY
jgi:hypothetical protein